MYVPNYAIVESLDLGTGDEAMRGLHRYSTRYSGQLDRPFESVRPIRVYREKGHPSSDRQW